MLPRAGRDQPGMTVARQLVTVLGTARSSRHPKRPPATGSASPTLRPALAPPLLRQPVDPARRERQWVNALVKPTGRTSWPVSRILFRTAGAVRRRPSIWAHRRRVPRAAYPQIRASSPRTPARPHEVRSSWPCFGWGLPSRTGHPARWCALTAPFHPYHLAVAVCFLWHYPASHLGLLLAITLLCEVRTFLDPLSRAAAARPTRPR